MAGIWFEDGSARIRSYSSTTKGQQRLVRIELEVLNTYELGSLLRQLDEMQEPKSKKVAAPKKPTAPLLIEDRRDRP
ncbi:MAG: hypothetical protein ABIF45_17525 [Pseudomonadota bacterium]